MRIRWQFTHPVKKRTGFAAAVVLLFSFHAQLVIAQDTSALNGTWEGKLTYVDLPGDQEMKGASIEYRVVIGVETARVFAGEKRTPLPNMLMSRLKTNALIYFLATGRDSDGVWVETQVFAVTLKDKNTLMVRFYRVVNNNDMPATAKGSKWSFAASGELQRAGD